MSTTSPLSETLRCQYRTTCALSESMMSKIDLNCLELDDSDLSLNDVTPMCSFLSSKEATLSIETLILKSKLHRAEFSNGIIGTSNVHLKESVQSRNPFAIGGKLMNALIVFISDCINLHSIIIDSLQMDADFVTGLGEALSTSKSVVRWLSFKSCPLGNSGVRILRPHISQMHLQVLVFEKCGLSDESCDYLSSIIKAQEAMLDTLFWNTTLRSDPLVLSDTATTKRTLETNQVLSSGLVALSVNGNYITRVGVHTIVRALSNNHWFLGLNIANNTIDHDGVDLLVRSLRDNNALHALLLGGNPGFSMEAAQCAGAVTRKAPLRLSLMPKGVSMLLRRWMQLQSSEMTGGVASANTSLSRYPVRTIFEPLKPLPEPSAEHLNNSSKRNNDLSDFDADSSRISFQAANKWVQNSNGAANHQYLNDINSDRREVRPSSDVIRSQDPRIGRPLPSRSAWKDDAPTDRLIDPKQFMGAGPDTHMISAFKPRSESYSRSFRIPTTGTPLSTGHSALRASAAKYYLDDQFIPGFYTRPKAPAGSASVDRSRSRTEASPASYYKASPSGKETLDQQLRQMVSSSSGRRSYEVAQRERVGASNTQRYSSPSLMARRQANACTRLSQGIASVERSVPALRARQSPQRREYGLASRNGRGDSEDESRRANSAGRASRSRSPSNRSAGSSMPLQKSHAAKSHQEEQLLAATEGIARKKKKKKRTPSPIFDKDGEDDVQVKSAKEPIVAIDQKTLEGVISRFSDSVNLINRSLVTVSDQLRDVSGTLSASVLERTRSSSESGSPANRSVTTSLMHTDITPVRSDIMTSSNGQSQSKVPLSIFSPATSKTLPEDNGADHDHSRDNLAQTFGRSRGSLMHRSGSSSNGTLLDDKTHSLYSCNGNSNSNSNGADRGSASQKTNKEPSSPARHSPAKAISSNRGPKQTHNGHAVNHNSSCHDRWSARILSASLPSPTGSADASFQVLRHNTNGTDADIKRKATTSEVTVISDIDMASLIRDRLRKKLKSILRPASPSPGAKSKSFLIDQN